MERKICGCRRKKMSIVEANTGDIDNGYSSFWTSGSEMIVRKKKPPHVEITTRQRCERETSKESADTGENPESILK
jgi:hypothetical protein